MSTISENNKRIAKNTIFLYLRTLFVMAISLYTSRVVLQVLGVDNYGVYQVVGGLVAMFSVISSSLSSAISRFITFELGTGNINKLKKIFATSIVIQLCISAIVILSVEIVGLWFLHSKMQIPEGRMNAAEWVLHCSLLTFCINLLSSPYNACIIAHEHMKAFAYVSIIEVLLKLGVVFLIAFSPIDRLIFYAILLTLAAAAIRFIYMSYCHRNFEESRTKLVFDRTIFKEMFGFSGWSFFNNTAFILNNQGVNMLMNVFFGITVNAARGIALQVENSLLSFVNSFTTAVNPQITKSYAAGDLPAMHKLVCRGAKFSFFMMFILALPIILEAEQILKIWLVNVPEYTVIFVQLSLIMGLCDCLGKTGFTACMATGKIRNYSIIITSIGILEFPLAWFFFARGYPPFSAYCTYIVVKIMVLITRMFLLKKMVGLSVRTYTQQIFLPVIVVSVMALILPIVVVHMMVPSLLRIVVVTIVSIISASLAILYIGMTKSERGVIVSKLGKISYVKKQLKS